MVVSLLKLYCTVQPNKKLLGHPHPVLIHRTSVTIVSLTQVRWSRHNLPAPGPDLGWHLETICSWHRTAFAKTPITAVADAR